MERMMKHWGKWAVITLLIVFVGLSLGGKGCWRSKSKRSSLSDVGSSAPPSVPTFLTATCFTHNEILLGWQDNSDNETGFAIQRQTGVEPWAQIATLGADIQFYLDTTGLLPLTTYSYRVRAYNAGGDQGYSNTASATTQAPPAPPNAPSNLTATPISDSQIDLTWSDNSGNETGFKIERSPDGVTYAGIHTTASDVTDYSDTGLYSDTLYYYRVLAYDAAGDSGYSNTVSAKTLPPPAPPNAPSNLTANDVSSSQIDLTWSDNSDDETGFAIERSPDGTTYAGIDMVGADVISYSDTGLTPETTYWYRVKAYNVVGASEYSNTASGTTQSIPVYPPDAPSNLVATPISSSEIDLSWMDNSDDETGFEIERSPNMIDYTQIGTVAADVTAYSDTGLTPDTFYFYRVRAFNPVGDSGYSNVAETFTPDTLPLDPSDLVAATASSSQIDLSWSDNSGNETGFEIEYKITDSPYVSLTTVNANTVSYSHAGLDPDTWYSYRVRAVNDIGNSAYSNEASATTDNVPPDAPTNLIATIISSSQIDLTWTDNSDNETGFEIEVSLDETTWFLVDTVGVDVTAYSCTTGINPDTLYYGRVRAVNAAGESAWSNVVSGTTPPAPTLPDAPSDLILTVISSSQIDLAWTDNSDNETGFEIVVNPGGATWFPVDMVGADVVSYSATGLDPDTWYCYRLRAFNATGNSDWLLAVGATTQTVPGSPDAPSNLWATAISDSQIDLAWTDNSGNETGFKIERSPDGATATYAQIGTASADATAYSDTGLTPETKYWYRVRAFNAVGDSAISNVAWATTQAGAPPSGAVFYIFGGDIPGTVDLTEIVKFDVAAGTALKVADLPLSVGKGRYSTSAVWDPDNKCAYILGGMRYKTIPLDEIVKYDPALGTVVVIANLPSARMYLYGNTVWDPVNKCAYILGGRTADLVWHDDIMKFDPATLEVTTLAVTLPQGNSMSSAVWDPVNHCAYIFGGIDYGVTPAVKLDTIVKFDPSAGTCAAIPGAVLPEEAILSCTVWDPSNNVAYNMGGLGSATLDTIVKFDPAAGTVTTLGTTLPQPTCAGGAAWDPVNHCAYIFGDSLQLDTIVKFDPAIPEATILTTKLPSGRSAVSACPGQ